MGLALSEADEPYRYPIQLYHRVANQADLEGKRVLDGSSGHGGGASYLARTLRRTPTQAWTSTRMRSPSVRSTTNARPDLRVGDAESVPFADGSFDAVVNVEASHCYPRFPVFLDEVTRVLKPGGRFLYADLRPRLRIGEWEGPLWPPHRCG